MGLESATFIHELNANNPVGSIDKKSQGDDHFRLIKFTIQNTFANIKGAVTASHTELNKLKGVTATTAELNKLAGLDVTTAELNMLKDMALQSGVYTPVITITGGGTIVVVQPARWMRVGSIISVAGAVSIGAPVTAGATLISIPLPIASNFTSNTDLTGTGTELSKHVLVFEANVGTKQAQGYPSGAGLFMYNFCYTVK